MLHLITAITGASGAIYGQRFMQQVNWLGHKQTILISDPAREVIAHELGLSLPQENRAITEMISASWELNSELIAFEDINNLSAGIASGSQAADAMVIIPCTMGTIARIIQGLASNLLERAFDVMLKEKKKLIVVPRETPFNQIHLRNMLALNQLNVDIIPAMPTFYHQPETIIDLVDFIVGRVLEHLSLEHSLYQRWEGKSKR